MPVLLTVFGIFLMAYGNAMNNVVFRRKSASAEGKDVRIPGVGYRTTAIALMALGFILTAYVVTMSYWLRRDLVLWP